MDLEERAQLFRFDPDRDGKYTDVFDEVFTSEGIEVLLSPPQAPRANAYAERWVRTARRECLDRMLIYNPRHLLAVLGEFVAHHNKHRLTQDGEQMPRVVDQHPVQAFATGGTHPPLRVGVRPRRLRWAGGPRCLRW